MSQIRGSFLAFTRAGGGCFTEPGGGQGRRQNGDGVATTACPPQMSPGPVLTTLAKGACSCRLSWRGNRLLGPAGDVQSLLEDGRSSRPGPRVSEVSAQAPHQCSEMYIT